MSRLTRAARAALLGAALLPVAAPAQRPRLPLRAIVTEHVDARVHARLAGARRRASVSAVLLRGGDTLAHRAWEMADAVANRAATRDASARIASAGRQLTAALVLDLVARGREDDVVAPGARAADRARSGS